MQCRGMLYQRLWRPLLLAALNTDPAEASARLAASVFRAIVNAHFAFAPPTGLSPMVGVVSGMVEWIFVFRDRVAVTISGADRLLGVSREQLADQIWQEVAKVLGIARELPRWQLIKER